MLRWSLKLFRVRGIPLAVHGSFFLLLIYFADEGWQDDGLVGMGWSVLTLLTCFACVLLHELGHSSMAMHFGVRVRRILLMPIGGMAEFDFIPREPVRELLITLAGPAVNFIIAAGLYLIARLPQGWPLGDFDYPGTPAGFAQLLITWNLLMGCFNLLPVFPMDGGRIFRALLATRMSYLRATRWAVTVGKVLAVAAALIAVFGFHRYLAAVLFGFIYFAGESEYRALVRREREDASPPGLFPRPSTASMEEPPILTP